MADSIWQISDGVALLGNGTWLTDNGRMVRGSVGAELDHGKDVRTFIEYREIANNDDQYLALGLQYKLSKRYSFNASPTWNMKEDDLQNLRLNLTRHYPDFDLVGQVTHNSIKDETQYGIAFRLLKF
jgi:predicted porin